MRALIDHLQSKGTLPIGEIHEAFEALLDGQTPEGEIREFLESLAKIPVEVDWLVEAASVLREHCISVDLGGLEAIDTAGTGGDQSGSFNFSTAAALLAAACEVPVAKHGNRSISSKSGSADLLEALRIPIDLDPSGVRESIEAHGFGFMMAPNFHPHTGRVQKIRRELKKVTVFNFLGPLVNPAGVKRQMIGVYNNELRGKVAEALKHLGVHRAWVLWGEGGLDEMSMGGKTFISEVGPEEIREIVIEPKDAGLRACDPQYLKGGDGEKNAKLLKGIFSQEFFGPILDGILLNAGAALVIAGVVEDIKEGVRRARLAIEEGKAGALIDQLSIAR